MEKLREDASVFFHYKNRAESEILDFALVPGVTLQWLRKSKTPIWCQIIGAPSSGKTAHLSLYKDWKQAKFISSMTKNSLISGYREQDSEEDPSLLPLLHKKLFVIKDFTLLLQGSREERESVIGQLRDAFDGHMSRNFGNIGLMEYVSRFNLILGVTNVIDGFHSVNQQLGERFICRREYSESRVAITGKALHKTINDTEETNTEDFTKAWHEFLDHIPHVGITQIKWPKRYRNLAIMTADFIAKSRSHVVREKDGMSIASRAAPEVGARLVTQIAQVISAYCIMHGLKEVNNDAWDFGGARVLRDTLPTPISWVLFNLYRLTRDMIPHKSDTMPVFYVRDLLELTTFGWKTTNQVVTDLHHNHILGCNYAGKIGTRNNQYYLHHSAYEILKKSKIFDGFTDKNVDLETLRFRIQARDRFHHPRLVKRIKRKKNKK